jgi:hypothetical protein
MYAVAAALGIAGRLDWAETPAWLQQPWVIVAAIVLFAVEFVVDKVPAVDSTWDAVHTAIRPTAGAALMAGADADAGTVALAALGATLALSSHLAKATLRALVNTSPEPVSNVAVSVSEDGLVAVLMALAIANPEAALVVTIVLFVASIVTTIVLFRFVRRLWRRVTGRRSTTDAPPRLDR